MRRKKNGRSNFGLRINTDQQDLLISIVHLLDENGTVAVGGQANASIDYLSPLLGQHSQSNKLINQK